MKKFTSLKWSPIRHEFKITFAFPKELIRVNYKRIIQRVMRLVEVVGCTSSSFYSKKINIIENEGKNNIFMSFKY